MIKINENADLDIFIAEKVMGWSIYTSGRGSIHALENENTDAERDYVVKSNHPWDTANFSPSTDPASALEVLKKCAEHMKNGIMGIASPIGDSVASTIKKPSQGWVVGFIGKPSNFDVEAETLEIAICLFAKKLYSK